MSDFESDYSDYDYGNNVYGHFDYRKLPEFDHRYDHKENLLCIEDRMQDLGMCKFINRQYIMDEEFLNLCAAEYPNHRFSGDWNWVKWTMEAVILNCDFEKINMQWIYSFMYLRINSDKGKELVNAIIKRMGLTRFLRDDKISVCINQIEARCFSGDQDLTSALEIASSHAEVRYQILMMLQAK